MLTMALGWGSTAWTILRTSMWARIVAVSMLGLATVQVYGCHQRQVGARQVIEKSKQVGEKINERNESVRAATRRPGAAERLLQDYCRDC